MAPPPPPVEAAGAGCTPGRSEDSGQPCESTRALGCNEEEADWVVVMLEVEVVEVVEVEVEVVVWSRGDMLE